jgi:hypothetical protein
MLRRPKCSKNEVVVPEEKEEMEERTGGLKNYIMKIL